MNVHLTMIFGQSIRITDCKINANSLATFLVSGALQLTGIITKGSFAVANKKKEIEFFRHSITVAYMCVKT